MLEKLIRRLIDPLWQAALAAGLMIVLGGADALIPQTDTFMDEGFSPWAMATAMILSFIILNSLYALKVEVIIPYWSRSVMSLLGLMCIGYGWCYLLTGKHIDEVGSIRWLWFVLTLVWLVFFTIVRSMKRIVDLAIRQDKKLRGED